MYVSNFKLRSIKSLGKSSTFGEQFYAVLSTKSKGYMFLDVEIELE